MRSITIEAPAGAAVSLLPASASDLLPRAGDVPRRAPETDAMECHVEITWTVPAPGRVPLPLRPPRAMAIELLDACRVAR